MSAVRRRVAASLAALAAVAALVASAPAPGKDSSPGKGGSPGRGSAEVLRRDTAAVHQAGAIGVAAVLDTPSGTATARAGEADLRTGAPMRTDAHYRAGSTVKTLVATVALQLVGEGRLDLEDTVDRWLPGVVSGHGNDGRRITVRQLLQHTSGLRGYTSIPEVFPAGYSARGYYENRFRHYTAGELVAAAVGHPPNSEPGAAYRYSNTNYVVIGMIIERVTGHPWRTEVRDRVIRPLGLTGTSLPGDHPYLPAPYAHGYHTYAEDGRRVDTTVFNSTAADASGDLVTTPMDVNRFFGALLTGRLLRPAELAEMRRTVPIPDEPGRRAGLGLETTPLSCGGFYWHHGGNALGYSSENGVTTDGRRAVTVSTNSFDESDTGRQEQADRAVKALIDHALCRGDG
ncbi:serine hydrolase domain-containing protein [Streptomyces sp. FXJ1.4098]|uniref:serine hydrolase domain-containing protein n=1 Tax=Streptomyces sp. NPDC020845 TaxID=3365096 RepID=UPI0029912107|nr:serine hydrolase domain-containing protein [Streptomyces sp. FXJ1.4098]